MFFQLTSTILLAILLSVLAAPVSISLAWRFHMIDKPGSEAHKIHKLAMPRAGGIIIFLIGVIGIYLSKVFLEIKDRPLSIIKNIYRKE